MGTADGTVINGCVKILNNGPDNARFNIVLIAEGFTQAEDKTFKALCQDFVSALQAEPWYPTLGNAINVHQLVVYSNQSGVDDPATCKDKSTGTGTNVNTYFDAKLCGDDQNRRSLIGDTNLVITTLDDQMPGLWSVGGVIVNSKTHSGTATGRIFWTGIPTGWTNIALHELGHAGFKLGDEYEYNQGCNSTETDRNYAPASEPWAHNVTAETDRKYLKWRHLLTPGAPVPTMLNSDCTKCDQRPNVLDDDAAIGLFEGAGTYHCGYFRPAYRCRMRNNTLPFCRVCVEEIAKELNNIIPATPIVEVVPQFLDFGDVAHGLTIYLPFEVRNRRSGRPGKVEITLTMPTGSFFYAPDTETSFTLPAPIFEAYTSRTIYVAFRSIPKNDPMYLGQLSVTRTDLPNEPLITVNLQARAVSPVPVDSVLVLDRSGSMIEPTGVPKQNKVDLAIEAANLYVSLLRENDKIGVVRYNHNSGPNDVLLNLRSAGNVGTGSGRLAAWNTLNTTTLHPAGWTSIGGGMINASSVLDGATADARALVVLTDGIQNTLPDIPSARQIISAKKPKQRVFAVGLGLNQLEDKLQQIASVTHGAAYITGDKVDDREFLLQKLYVQILSDINDEAFVRDPINVAHRKQRQSTTIHLGEVDVAADFIVVFRYTPLFPKYMRLELESPDGALFTPSDINLLPNAEFASREGHAFFRWQFPMFPQVPARHHGVWKLWVENQAPSGEYFAYEDLLTYSVMVKTRSDLRLGGRIVQSSCTPGSVMHIILEPTLFGVPIHLDQPVFVEVTRPDGVKRKINLIRDAQGIYTSEFTDTGLVGPYMVQAEVTATTPKGFRVTRFRQMTGIIFVPNSSGGFGESDDKLCQDAGIALELLQRVIRRCCAAKPNHDSDEK